MKRLTMTMVVGLFAATMAAPSHAADLPRGTYKAPIYSVPGYSWTGFYAGINGGYGFGKSDWSGAGGAGSTSPKGAMAGVTAGYNLQTGSWVWGLEADFDASWVKGSTVGTGASCGGVGCETKNPWLATGRARLGYAGWDRWLPFITGGAAYGQVKMTPNVGNVESKNRFGYAFGGGVEYALMSNWTVKAEYLYVDLGTANCSNCGVVGSDVTFKENIVRAGLNYRF